MQSGRIIALVEECVECFQDEHLSCLRRLLIEWQGDVLGAIRLYSNCMAGAKKIAKNQVPSPPLVAILQALSDPVRLELVRQLAEEGEKPCGSFGIDMPKSTMSHHFGILRKSGVLSYEKQGSLLMNRLEREYLDTAFPGFLDSVLTAAESQRKTSKKKR